jgi:hypothetical protein
MDVLKVNSVESNHNRKTKSNGVQKIPRRDIPIEQSERFHLNYLYNRRGKDSFDRIYLFVLSILLLFISIYFIQQFISFLSVHGLRSFSQVVLPFFGGMGGILLSILLFPIGYGRIEITPNQICIIPSTLFNPLPLLLCFDTNVPLNISYYPEQNLLLFSQKDKKGRIYVTGMKKAKSKLILAQIKNLSQINPNVKLYE